MRLTVKLDERGMLPDAFGKYCDRADLKGHLCGRSFPFEADDLPAGTRALAWIMLDWDSTPVCGFPWIHWCAWMPVDEGATRVALPEDASRIGIAGLAQGYTSSAKSDPAEATGYVGPCPPDRDHVYTLHVVALDEPCGLAEPFWANQLVGAARDHVLAEATVQLPSRS